MGLIIFMIYAGIAICLASACAVKMGYDNEYYKESDWGAMMVGCIMWPITIPIIYATSFGKKLREGQIKKEK